MNILGYPYTVQIIDGMENMGRLRTGTLTMQISAGLCPEQRVSTVLHEIIEALNEHLGLELPHHSIMALETGLYQTLTANGVDLRGLIEAAG
jgi:hypothetical protein